MKKLLLLTIIFLGIFVVSCTKDDKKEVLEEFSNPQELQILEADSLFSQEQLLSRIKAEHLKLNNGYLDTDELSIIITLRGDSLIDTFNKDYIDSEIDLQSYINSVNGIYQSQIINRNQNELIKVLQDRDLINDVVYTYSTLMNGICVKTTYGNINKIRTLSVVEDVLFTDVYNQPTTKATVSNVENVVDIYDTGIYKSSSVEYTGNNTAVAVLDSGFDCSHSVFSVMPEIPMFSKEDIASKLSLTEAAKITKDISINDVYYSAKIPFIYDYADKDTDAFPYDSEHGTHVSGIIGGNDDVITGVAVNTQLVLMKVFPDLDAGGRTEDIVLALEDAVTLGVDVINLSLGTSCGFAREYDNDAINQIYEKIADSGISIITAASNDYSSAFGGEQGNTNKVTNPDSGTVGSPSTYNAALSVASISGVKSKYIYANDEDVVFFKESNATNGKENNFFEELGLNNNESRTYEYVTVPGVGLKINYKDLDVKGKIALVKRGNNTFEEKAKIAKEQGAVACIIYNNIEGDILMSMGKTDHIPTISISRSDGVKLALKDSGKMVISYQNAAGPFMSDFSSWGPTPTLDIKPEITSHGGTIKSSIPGGGYDELSGTSMATPNLAGVVVLIRGFLKDKYPDKSIKDIAIMANALLMSTATIARNEYGNPYAVRKQGAGLASLYNAVNSKAYITVDNNIKPKLELRDDPKRTGVYEMNFNVNNLSDEVISYDLSVLGLTESVSTSDQNFVSEISYVLSSDDTTISCVNGTINGKTLTVNPGVTSSVKVIYKLNDTDKAYIENSFPNGMYVEGFVKLVNRTDNDIDLNIPFLAFYGDWTQAPLFDKTYYEVESEAHNIAIDDEDKIKADYYATTPYGSYYYNYMIPLGTYLYDVDTELYDPIPASIEKIAVSNVLGAIDGISTVYMGLLRNAKKIVYTITDKITGEVIYEYTEHNAAKAHYYNGIQLPHFEDLKIKSAKEGWINNREYEFNAMAYLDYGDGGVDTNNRNTFSFDFTMDDEAPVIKKVTYEKKYDKTLKKDRYYMNLTVYDNQYAMSVTPIIFTSNSSYTFLSKDPVPVYSQKGSDSLVKIEITDYLEDIYSDKLITSAIAFSIDDYALNSNLFMVQLPGTKGEFKFTKDGSMEGTDLLILSMYEDELVDLTSLLATKDVKISDSKDYLNHLKWTSSNEDVVKVNEGILQGMKEGRATIIVEEALDAKKAALLVNVRTRPDDESKMKQTLGKIKDVDGSVIESLKFSYFETIFSYSRAAQTNEIGKIGSRNYISALGTVSFYPGEKIKLFYDFNPWYVENKYKLSFASSNERVATVDEDGVVTGLKEGSTVISLKVEGSNVMATLRISVKNEFVIESRMLVAYKGLGGDVVIPDDEGILYISSYAFCLYDTDQSIELSDDDYDANKIPSANTTITSITIPEGVEEIQKYAFYNCTGLKKVSIPKSVKVIREYAFMNDAKLETVDLSNIEVIGKYCFYGCEKLQDVSLNKIYAIGERAFEKCKSLTSVNLTTLRNTGARAFKDTTNLTNVVLGENTKLAKEMFVNSGFSTIDIYEGYTIPEWCFAQCKNLVTVNFHKPLIFIEKGAFSECDKLANVNFSSTVNHIQDQAFYSCTSLNTLALPNGQVSISEFAFYKCSALNKLIFNDNSFIYETSGYIFKDTSLSEVVVSSQNTEYKVVDNLVLSLDGTILYFALSSSDNVLEEFIIPETVNKVYSSALSNLKTKKIVVLNKNLTFDDYSACGIEDLTVLELPLDANIIINNHAFNVCNNLEVVVNSSSIKHVGEYAFANTNLKTIELTDNLLIDKGAFFKSSLESITLGANTILEDGSIQECKELVDVNFTGSNITVKQGAFAFDTKLKNIDLSKVYGVIGTLAFYNCTSLKVANLENVTEVGVQAFLNCKSLNTVKLPKVKVLKEGAFSYEAKAGTAAPSITEIILPDTLEVLEKEVFAGCKMLKEISIPEGIKAIPNFSFYLCSALEKVTLPNSVTEIGEYAFAGCENLTEINTTNVTSVGKYGFSSCQKLPVVDLTNTTFVGEASFANCYKLADLVNIDKLTVVGEYAFQKTLLKSFNAINLEEIKEGAFTNMEELLTFTISNNLKKVGDAVFHGSTKLTTFNALSEDGKLVSTIKFDNFLLNDGSLYGILPNGKYILKAVPAGLINSRGKVQTVLNVIENTVRVEIFAGNKNPNIIHIMLPESLKAISNHAFYGFKSLEDVRFLSIVAPTLESTIMTNVTLPETAPGYELLHNSYDLFGLELYYHNFVDLVGKNKPIKIEIPGNSDIKGYNSLPYEAYFGELSSASIVLNDDDEPFIAKSVALVEFLDLIDKVQALDAIRLKDDTLINNALTVLNRVKDDVTLYGITDEQWDGYKELLTDAKSQVTALKQKAAGTKVARFNDRINLLPDTFDLSLLAELNDISLEYSLLANESKDYVDLTKYNELVKQYKAYIKTINDEASIVISTSKQAFANVLVTISLSAIIATSFFILRKITKGGR